MFVKIKHLGFAFLAATIAGTSGCGIPLIGYREYAPKEGEPSANIKFVSNGSNTTVYMLNEARCDKSSFGYEVTALNSLFGREKKIKVRAEQRLYIRMKDTYMTSYINGMATYDSCNVRLSFIPARNVQYLVEYRTSMQDCKAVVFRYEQSGGEIIKTPESTAKLDCVDQ